MNCNMTSNMSSNRGTQRSFYTVFPTPDSNINETESFIKTIVGNEDLRPWTDVQGLFISWTVELSQDQVTQLVNHSGIKEVSTLSVPPASSNAPDTTALPHAVPRAQTRSEDDIGHYIVVPNDPADTAQCDQITELLKSLSNEEPLFNSVTFRGKTLAFWGVHLTQSQRDDVAKHPGVKGIELDGPIYSTSVSSSPKPHRKKRDVTYATQKDAVTELVSISQPSTVPDIGQLKNYVFEQTNGARSYIYHVEFGVAFRDLAAEFPHISAQHVLTPLSQRRQLRPDQDGSTPAYHSTCTAGKMLGQLYGSSKGATLVVVRLAEYTMIEMVSAFTAILTDLNSHPERIKFSVVCMALQGIVFHPDNSWIAYMLSEAIGFLLLNDVPVVVSAGNAARDGSRQRIDAVPAIFAADTYPLIVVGSCNAAGFRSDFSQTGPQLTTYAVGEGATCLRGEGDQPSTGHDGTSFSTPLVAGEIANLLSADTVPFDTSDGKLSASVRDYLMNKEPSGWPRQPGVRALWNGVTEAQNPPEPAANVPATPNSPPVVTKKCAGLADNKYLARETLRSIIEDQFCPDAVAQGGLDKDSASIMRRYYQGTLEDVSVAINYKPGSDVKLNKDDCIRYLLGDLTDGCDGNDPQNNPANYKGGGEVTVGPVAYLIQPQATRQPARLGVQAKCDSSWKVAFNDYTVWGHGFASGDSGAALKREVEGCALLPKTWSFQYGLGSDGREWTAKFRTGVFQKRCVGHAVATAGAPPGFGCGGSG